MKQSLSAIGVLFACACAAPPATSERQPSDVTTPATQPTPAYVGRAWLATDDAAAPGTLRVFLPDGTLLMDSCFETYRLARWRALDAARIEWTEDTARIEAQVLSVSDTELRLRLQLKGETKEERYRAVASPFVCPDLRP